MDDSEKECEVEIVFPAVRKEVRSGQKAAASRSSLGGGGRGERTAGHVTGLDWTVLS